MEKKDILRRIKESRGYTSDTQFAEALGITVQALRNWYARDSMDEYRVMVKCPEIAQEFILNGTEPMLKAEMALPQLEKAGQLDHPADADLYVLRSDYEELLAKCRKLEERVTELADELIAITRKLIDKP